MNLVPYIYLVFPVLWSAVALHGRSKENFCATKSVLSVFVNVSTDTSLILQSDC